MNCGDIQDLIALHALGGLDEEQKHAVQAHLQRCRECRVVQADYRLLLGDLRRQAGPPVSNLRLIRRTMAAARDALRTASRRRWRGRSLLRWGPRAAVLVLGTLLLCLTQVGPENPGPSRAGGRRYGPALQPQATLWMRQAAGSTLSTLGDDIAIGAGRVFVLAEEAGRRQMVALESRSGRTLWRCSEMGLGYLSADDRCVYGLARASGDGVNVVAVEHRTGQVLWRYPAGSSQDPSGYTRPRPLAEGRLCWSCGDTVYGIDAAGGGEIWRRTLAGERVLSEAVESGPDLYVAGPGNVYCLDARTGALRAKSACGGETGGWIRPLLAVGGRRLFLATALRDGRSRVSCLDVRTHHCLWEQTVPRVSHLQAEGTSVFLRCQDVYALDPKSGRSLWQYPATGCSPITTCQGLVWFVDGADRGALVALDRASGARKWQVPGLRSCQGVLVAGTTAYLKTADSRVYAFGLGS